MAGNSPNVTADISFEEKKVFYKQLDELEAFSDDNDEVVDDARQQSRDFLARAKAGSVKRPNRPTQSRSSTQPSKQPNTIYKSSTTASKGPSAGAIPSAGLTPTVIDATPSHQEQFEEVNQRRPHSSKSFVQDTPLGSRSTVIASLRRTQTTPGAASTSNSLSASAGQLPATKMACTSRGKKPGKEKNKAQDRIPEGEQILKGLRLLYIQGARTGLRKIWMERAETFGAVVTKNISEATHIVVDSSLIYEDVKGHIPSVSGKDQPILVTDQWPLECIKRQVVTTPSRKFRPKGTPTDEPTSTAQVADLETQAPNAELELKKSTTKWDYVSPETTQSSDRLADSDPGGATQQQSQRTVDATVCSPAHSGPDVNEVGDETPQASHIRRSNSGFGDELAEIVHRVREKFNDLPRISEDDANSQGDGGKEKPKDDDSESDTDGERKAKRRKTKQSFEKKSFEEYFACNRGGTNDAAATSDNPNAETISSLQKMCEYYSQTNDHWRITSYRKAIKVLEKITDRKINTADEASQLPCFGPRLSAHLEEIVTTHSMARLEYANNDPMSKILSLFLGIYGVGKATADKWIAKGFRTLDDLTQKAKLTDSQRLGIEHYEDLNTRIPRVEVTQLGDFVKAEAARLDPSVTLLLGGSYRRGADSSGDIDFIVTKAGTTSCKDLVPFLDKLVGSLWHEGFLTAELATHSSNKDSDGSKWHGCCVLPRIPGFNDDEAYRPVWRRIDLLLVPESEYGAALIYFTGNDIFNRSIRLLASRKGMRLNQRGLYKDVMRGADRVKVTEGELVEGKDEKKIFEILKVKWREPHERWC